MTTLLLVIGPALSTVPRPPEGRAVPQPSAATVDNSTFVNANQILMFVTNHGNFGRDLDGVFGDDWGTIYPYTSVANIEAGATWPALYAVGLWVGGVDAVTGDTLVTVSEYSSEYVPGPMVGGTYQTDRPEFRVYKLYSDSLESNPNQDYLNWPVDQGAPVDGDGHPDMLGDQMLWCVYNDADPEAHDNNNGETVPMGVEIQQTVWAFDDNLPHDFAPIEYTHVGPGAGSLQIAVARPSLLTGHVYMVVFETNAYFREIWKLVDLTMGDTVMTGTDRTGDADNPVVDGLLFKVVDSGQRGVADWLIPSGIRRFSWSNADGFDWEGFYGALGWGGPGDLHGFGDNEPVPQDSLVQVLLKLAPVDTEGNFNPTDANVSYAYRYLRAPGPPARPEFEPFIVDADPPGGSYGFQDFARSCPLSAWNVSVDPPQRLALGYLENNQEFGLVDGKYWPPESDWLGANLITNTSSVGPREWLWIYLDEYTETPKPEYMLNAIDDPMPIMYWATWSRRGSDVPFEAGDEFQIIPGDGYSLSEADTFYFQAPDPVPPPEFDPEDYSIYVKYRLINKGGRDLEDFFVSLWTDPDLGYAGDDLVGCDTLENRWFCYNETNWDRLYGDQVPAVGFKLLEGPIVASPGDTATVDGSPVPNYKNLGLYSFVRFLGGLDPDNYAESYQYMWGLRAKETGAPPYVYNGDTLTWQFSGDPVTVQGDLDFAGDDRRMMASFGPFDFLPGDTQTVMIKLAVGDGTDYLNSITVLREILEYVPTLTDVNDEGMSLLPQQFDVAQNYPNPFNPSTTIEYSIPVRSEVEIVIFNVLGRKVATLHEGVRSAGEYSVIWNGVDHSGNEVATGVYFYRVRAGDQVQTKKMLLLK